MRIELSYEERIINALNSLPRKRGEHFMERDQREFTAIRAILQPLYARVEELEAENKQLRELLTDTDYIDPDDLPF